MHNPDRGEFVLKFGGLEVIISPTYGRQSRATVAVAGRSVQSLLLAMSTEGMSIIEQAMYLEQLSKPRIKSDDIGKALAKAGALKAGEVMGEVLKNLAKGSEDDEEDEGDPPLSSDDEDDGGKQ